MKRVKLKVPSPDPCPFCGGKAKIFGSGVAIIVNVFCNACHATGPDFMAKTELAAARKAVKHWNTRHPVKAQATSP